MKVRCVKTLNSLDQPVSESPRLTVGHTYKVLSIEMHQGQVQLRLVGDDPYTPGLFTLAQFEIVDGTLSRNWVISMSEAGDVEIGPAMWASPGFWTRFFDRDPGAHKCFDIEREIIESD